MIRLRALVLALAVIALLTGCSRPDTLGTAGAGNYIPGDGSVAEFAKGQRGDPIVFTAQTAEGKSLDIATLRGRVVVLNLWYAACGPCRAEARELADQADAFTADRVQFVGINVRDDADTVKAFQRTFKVPYPSVLDPDGNVVLALRGKAPPSAVPTTLVLDDEGRVAARILGGIDVSILHAMVTRVVAE